MRAVVVVDLAEGVEGGLASSQIREGTVGEDVGGDRAVHALDLALGLGW